MKVTSDKLNAKNVPTNMYIIYLAYFCDNARHQIMPNDLTKKTTKAVQTVSSQLIKTTNIICVKLKNDARKKENETLPTIFRNVVKNFQHQCIMSRRKFSPRKKIEKRCVLNEQIFTWNHTNTTRIDQQYYWQLSHIYFTANQLINNNNYYYNNNIGLFIQFGYLVCVWAEDH